jgi:hypothetical protein
LDIGDFIGVRGTVSERRVKSLFIFMAWRFWQKPWNRFLL